MRSIKFPKTCVIIIAEILFFDFLLNVPFEFVNVYKFKNLFNKKSKNKISAIHVLIDLNYFIIFVKEKLKLKKMQQRTLELNEYNKHAGTTLLCVLSFNANKNSTSASGGALFVKKILTFESKKLIYNQVNQFMMIWSLIMECQIFMPQLV